MFTPLKYQCIYALVRRVGKYWHKEIWSLKIFESLGYGGPSPKAYGGPSPKAYGGPSPKAYGGPSPKG